MELEELRAQLSLLGPLPSQPPEAWSWDRYRWELRRRMESEDLENMLTWPTVRTTMFVGDAPYVKLELQDLMRLPDWKKRWKRAIEEPGFGNPPRLPYYRDTSGNLVHQATHLRLLEQFTSIRYPELESVVEFGAGYGAMVLLLRRLGFKGFYYIYDFPELLLLQRYYLHKVKKEERVVFQRVVGNQFPTLPTSLGLLIACYSISEADEKLRRRFLRSANARYWLIAHQDFYGGVDLTAAFNSFMEWHDGVRWMTLRNPYLPGHRYIFGC